MSTRKAPSCGDGSSCMTRNLRNMQAFLGVQLTSSLDYSTMYMTQRLQCAVPDIANYRLFPGRPKWEENTWTHRWSVVCFLALKMRRLCLDDLKGPPSFCNFYQCCLLFVFKIFYLCYKFRRDFVVSLYDFTRNY